MNIKSLDGSMRFIERALDVSHLRGKVISENLANSETPGYKAGKVDFKKAMIDAESGLNLQMKRSNPGHLKPLGASLNGVKVDESKRPSRADGNNVDQELEIVNMSENTILYNSAAEMLTRKFKLIEFAIDEGAK